MTPQSISRRAVARPGWLVWLAALAVGLTIFYYFTGENSTLPVREVAHLQATPLTLDSVAAGPVHLPVQASGFIVTLTHDVAGPFTQPVAAGVFLVLLAVVLAGWVAVVSTLARTAFVAGMVPIIFLLLSLNTESLGIFNTSERYFLYLMLGLVGGIGFALHAFAEGWPLRRRAVVMGCVVAGLSALLLAQSQLPVVDTVLQLAAYATPGGAVLVVLLVLWVGIENIRALMWFNTQAEQPGGRFGLLPFVAASLLYLGVLALYVWNDDALQLLPGLNLDPLVLLLPAVVASWLGLRLRAPSYAAWVPYAPGMAQLYPLVVLGAAGALGYAFATANTPLLVAARSFTGLALLLLGAPFLLYVLVNFAPLIRQRLRVYRVVFEPRRLPFYSVYILSIGGLVLVQSRQDFPLPNQVMAGQYNNLGDLTRQQSEAAPDDLSLAGLAERYYAESGDVLYRANRHAEFGRAAIFRFRQQRRNEIISLRRALLRGPDEKVSLRLATLYNDPDDLFEGLDILRGGLKSHPRSAALAGDLAQLFTRTTITDSVAFYLDKAEQLAPGSYASRTNQLAFLLSQNLLAEARKRGAQLNLKTTEPALMSNFALLQLRTATPMEPSPTAPAVNVQVLDDASFAQLYHAVLWDVARRKAQLTPALLSQLNRLATQSANADYYEQLLFLQALARHALGQELVARQLLLPLAAGNTATSGYFQQLLALWQLQQGQYATAADQLAFASSHGAPQSAEMRIYALALSGNTDSVRVATARLLASPDSVQQRQGRQAQQLLAAGRPMPAADTTGRVGMAWLAEARRAEQQRNATAAAKSYQRIVREAPFNAPAILAAANFYTRRHDYTAAYSALRTGLDENPESLPLLRAYVLAAADAGLTEYAADALAQLRSQLPPDTYATLATEYAAHQAARAAAGASFSQAPAPSPLQ
ncbi:tetratricopeptide repeat protein [Hymenobacter segetis]|uniref:Tetratricopeptide repeat protein n=1 Tax=Hymenobacter segetis TaxID=2025509 RepID=A0ABU9LUM3_9BACT